MYDELVKSLRICGDSSDPIAECCYEDCTEHECPINPLCVQVLCNKAADAIEELSKRVDESIPKDDAEIIIAEVAKPRWIPVTERLPEECGWYLANVFSHGVKWGEITTKDSEWIQLVFYYEGEFHKLTGSNAKVTHWMPLPTPPTAEEG